MNDIRKTIISAAVLACAACAFSFAESAPATLTVDQAVEAALRNNINVKSAVVQERIKKRASDFSFNKFYPTISGTATALRLNSPENSFKAVPAPVTSAYLTPTENAMSSKGLYSYVYDYVPDENNIALGATVQEVFSPAYIELMNLAATDYQRSSITRAKAETQMTAAVKKFFFQLIVQKEAIGVTQARLENANERMRQAKVAFNAGQGSEINYIYARTNVNNVQADLQSMQTARLLALSKFEEMLDFDRRDDMELIGSLDDEKIHGADDLKTDGVRFDMSESEISLDQIKSALRIQDATLLPNLIVQYTADPRINGPTAKTIQDKENWHQTSGGISITLAWNVTGFIPGSETQIKRAELKDQLALASETARITRQAAMNDEQNQRRLIHACLFKIGNFENIVSDSKRAYELSDASYKAGIGRYLDLQSAEIALQGAQIQLLNERLNLLSLVLDLEAKYKK